MKRFPAPLALVLACLVGIGAPHAETASTEELVSARSLAGAYLAAETARATNDFDATVKYFRDALQFDPDNSDIQRELLLAYLTNGQFEEALPLAEKLKSEQQIERIARLALGANAIRERRYLKAESMLILTVESDPERLLTGIMRGWARHGAGETDAALEEIDQLEGPAWFTLFKSYHSALIAAAAGRTAQAERRFEEGMNNTSGGSASPQTYLRLAETFSGYLARNGNIERARETVASALEAAPTNPRLLALQDADDAALGATALKIAAPEQGAAEILFNLGTAINRDGAEDFALLYLQMARALNPESDGIYFELAGIAERQDAPQRAIDFYAKIKPNSPMKEIARLQTGLNLADMDREEEAKESLRTVLEENPDQYSAYLALGGVHASLKEFEQAAEVYESAKDNIDTSNPNFWPLYYRLGIAYERTDQWEKAEAAFKQALELSPDQPDVLNYLGYSWIDMNVNLEQGLEMIEKAVDMRPRDGYIVDSLGWAFYRLGRFEEAVEELERATDLMPRDPTINDHLGDAYWRVGRKLEATYQWAQTLDMEIEADDAALVRAKLNAGNTAGKEPEIAGSQADTETEGQAAVVPEKANDG